MIIKTIIRTTQRLEIANTYYSELIDGIGIKLLWWEYIGESDKKEQKEFDKSLKKKSITYKSYEGINTQMNYTFSSDKFMSTEEFNIFKYFFKIDNLGYDIVEYNYTNVGGSIHELRNYFGSIERALERFNFWKTRPIVLLYNEKKYKMNVQNIPLNAPIFYTQHKDSANSVLDMGKLFIFPRGCQPILDLNKFKQSKIVLQKININPIHEYGEQLDFNIDDSMMLSVINYRYKQDKHSKSCIDKSIDIFYDKRKLEKIDDFLTELKLTNLVIITDGEEFINPEITYFSFNYTSLAVSFTSNGKQYTKTFEGEKDPNYYFSGDNVDKRAKLKFFPPIYYTDCYNELSETFNSLSLNDDYFNDPSLNSKLANALASSPDWMNYKIERIILTRKSQWVNVTNKYTGLKESRFLLSDVYVKSTWNDKCYYQKDVYFTQKADPIEGFIYSIFVSVPQTLQPYPCNLE